MAAAHVPGPGRRENALLWELVNGVVRWRSLLDYHLDRLLSKPSGIPLKVRIVLRIGAYQLLFLDGVAVHAAVGESVELLARAGHAWAKGLVNAVLRRIARRVESKGREAARLVERKGMAWKQWAAAAFAYPVWMAALFEADYGRAGAEEIMRFNNQRAPLVLRVNLRRIGLSEFLAMMRENGVAARPGGISPAAVIVKDVTSPSSLPGFGEGLFYVQDEAAQLASFAIAPRKGERILDMCAGVGGKTTHLAELADAEIWASDPEPARLSLLEENALRLGADGIKTVDPDALMEHGPFDAVMVDAPCSGLGTIRRHPDIKWNRTPSSIASLAAKQWSILELGIKCLRPGGRLLYCTCTQTRQETLGVVDKCIQRGGGMEIADLRLTLPEPARRFVDNAGFFRTAPISMGPDLFFMALLKRG